MLDTKLSLGVDVYGKETLANSYQSYGTETYGATLRLGAPLTDELGTQWHYSLYNQSVSLDPSLLNCSPATAPASSNT